MGENSKIFSQITGKVRLKWREREGEGQKSRGGPASQQQQLRGFRRINSSFSAY